MPAFRAIQELAHILRLLAVAFWLLGLSQAFSALRMQTTQIVGPIWPYVTGLFALSFFVVATYLWLESKTIKLIAGKL